jgi:hypothetical protein
MQEGEDGAQLCGRTSGERAGEHRSCQGVGNQRFRTTCGTRGGRETGSQRTLPHGHRQEQRGTETNVPEEWSVAVRRDREPIANAAKRRRQKEAATGEHQAAAGERPPSPLREESGHASLSAIDSGRPQGAADTDRPQSGAANAGRIKAAREGLEPGCDTEGWLCLEARETLTGYLRTACLHPW